MTTLSTLLGQRLRHLTSPESKSMLVSWKSWVMQNGWAMQGSLDDDLIISDSSVSEGIPRLQVWLTITCSKILTYADRPWNCRSSQSRYTRGWTPPSYSCRRWWSHRCWTKRWIAWFLGRWSQVVVPRTCGQNSYHSCRSFAQCLAYVQQATD